MASFSHNSSPVCHISVFIQAVPPAGSLSCDFTLLDKLKQIAPRTYSRVAKPSRFDFFFFFFFLFFSQAKTCFLTTGAAGSQFYGSSEPDLKNTSIIPGDTIRGPVSIHYHLKYNKCFICTFFSSPGSYSSEL